MEKESSKRDIFVEAFGVREETGTRKTPGYPQG